VLVFNDNPAGKEGETENEVGVPVVEAVRVEIAVPAV
jgi:hypothetical protein